MSRYHFNIFDGVISLDPEGIELESQDEAQIQAIRYAGEIIRDRAKSLAVGDEWHMEVTDQVGFVLFRLDFFLTVFGTTGQPLE